MTAARPAREANMAERSAEVVPVVVDDLETAAGLHDAGAARWPTADLAGLEVGEVEAGERVLIERRTAEVLARTLREGVLLDQVAAVARFPPQTKTGRVAAPRPAFAGGGPSGP